METWATCPDARQVFNWKKLDLVDVDYLLLQAMAYRWKHTHTYGALPMHVLMDSMK